MRPSWSSVRGRWRQTRPPCTDTDYPRRREAGQWRLGSLGGEGRLRTAPLHGQTLCSLLSARSQGQSVVEIVNLNDFFVLKVLTFEKTYKCY